MTTLPKDIANLSTIKTKGKGALVLIAGLLDRKSVV